MSAEGVYALHTQMYRDSPTWVTSEPRNMFGIAWPFKPNTCDSELWRTITIVQQCATMHPYKDTYIHRGSQRGIMDTFYWLTPHTLNTLLRIKKKKNYTHIS